MPLLKPHFLKPLVPGARYLTTNKPVVQNAIPTWNDYFALRKKRRNYEIAFYLPSTTITTFATFAYFAQMQIDSFIKIGVEPELAIIGASVAAGFGGFFLGPVFGNGLFKLMNKKTAAEMDIRDKKFFEHIKKNRVNARFNSIRNPVPDYYGEKILSISDYRSWLRKQREHYRKSMFGGDANDLED